MDTKDIPPNRLPNLGLKHLYALLGVIKQTFELIGSEEPSIEAAEKCSNLLSTFKHLSLQLKDTLNKCQILKEKEALSGPNEPVDGADVLASVLTSSRINFGSDNTNQNTDQQLDLEQRRQKLQDILARKNETLKQAIDILRDLLGSMTSWDAMQRHIDSINRGQLPL